SGADVGELSDYQRFGATDLQNHAVLDVVVHRRDRVGRGHEDETDTTPHVPGPCVDQGLDLVEARVDQIPVERVLSDVEEGEPRTTVVKVADEVTGPGLGAAGRPSFGHEQWFRGPFADDGIL